jgi:hypothetical protein
MTKLLLLIAFFAITFSSFAQQKTSENINWPSEYKPAKSKFYVHNEIEINTKPEIVWAYLIDALKWQTWYKGAKNVNFTNQADTVLNANSIFN